MADLGAKGVDIDAVLEAEKDEEEDEAAPRALSGPELFRPAAGAGSGRAGAARC